MDKSYSHYLVVGTVVLTIAADAFADSRWGNNGIDVGTVARSLLLASTTDASSHVLLNVKETIAGSDYEVTPPNRSNGVVLTLKRFPRHQL